MKVKWKFHKREISKGVLGELSKVREELEEAEDALEQGQELMLLIELSDLVGAVGLVSEKYGISLDQLVTFAKLRRQVGEQVARDEAEEQKKFLIGDYKPHPLPEKENN